MTMPHDGAPAQADGRSDQWLAILDRYGVRFLILDRQRDDKLLRLIRSRPDWTVDFEDSDSVLFARTRLPEGMPSPFAEGLLTEARLG
jgi:hypothetical protein